MTRHARHQHRRHLIAQGFAGAGGHDGERVLLGQHGVDHGLLAGTQLGHAEDVAQDLRDLGPSPSRGHRRLTVLAPRLA